MTADVLESPNMAKDARKKPISLTIDPAIIEEAAKMGEADQRSLSFMFERAMREWLERHAPEGKRKLDKGK